MGESREKMVPSRDIATLVAVMAALRTPGTGCPWDLEQSFASIAPYTVEEAYEVADAIERNDMIDLKEELGDLLLQVVYHARLAEEAGAFDLGDVVLGITRKMIRRHPHVFGSEQGASTAQAKASWERIKAEEKAEKAAERKAARISARGGDEASSVPEEPGVSPLLADLPRTLPALTAALRLQDKAAAVGFDWPSVGPVLDKVREELAELEEVALAADPRRPGGGAAGELADAEERIEEELGDLLFVMANIGRHLSVHPERALRRANAKFTRRFSAIERRLAKRGRRLEDCTLAEMDEVWNEVKRDERR
jgi:ATP diphosphatase